MDSLGGTDTNGKQDETTAANPESGTRSPLGKSGHPVRVLNFAGGGFDTVMQLGVAHALLVIQGRAPDAIVGASAGAIQAAAVAEILQAGEDIDIDSDTDTEVDVEVDVEVDIAIDLDTNDTDIAFNIDIDVEPGQDAVKRQVQRYQQRRAIRVERFRDMVRAAQRAPEELIDASLPDAYQIDSRHPLQPLRTARFHTNERDERERHLRVRSGLVALYNQLLGVHLPIGTVTRMVRRWLGFQAADDNPGFWSKWLVKALELFRIWLLIGATLPRLVTAVPLLVRPVALSRVHARVDTAGNLIFRFRSMRTLSLGVLYSLIFFVLATTWVVVSALPALVPYCLLAQHRIATPYWVVAIGLPYSIPILMTVLQVARKHDAVTRVGALLGGLKGLTEFAMLLFLWGGLPYLVILAIMLQPPPWTWHWIFDVRTEHAEAAVPFLVGAAFSLLILAFVWLRYRRERAPRKGKGKIRMTFLQWYGKRFLQSYSLSRSLLHHYGLEKFLSDLFDANYYGTSDPARAWEDSLHQHVVKSADMVDSGTCSNVPEAKRIRDYCSARRKIPIALGLAVADVGSGTVDVMDENAPLVCGLRAATAWTPLFPAVRYRKRLFVDSMNISPVPMPALLSLLRRHGVNKKSPVIHVYRVAPVPFSRRRLPQDDPSKPILNLIDIAFRAFKLRRYRDADLERRLMERYSQVIPPGESSVALANREHDCFRMWVAPIELELPVGLNGRIMFADRTQRRAEILTTIARGCRAALEVMIADSVKAARGDAQVDMTVSCATAVRHHLTRGIDKSLAGTFGRQPLPGSRAATEQGAAGDGCPPPGLSEICRYCRLAEESASVPGSIREQALVWRDWENTAASWPHELDDKTGDSSDRHFATSPVSPPDPGIVRALGHYWPRERAADHARQGPVTRPLVSLLFSGGVFRGVFQVGVVNALNILGVKPDIVAGASIGSITAGMAAQLLCATTDEHERAERLARLTATYLAVDRVILTDRFADFVREFTIRASATRFSLRQADQLFRKYDQPWLVNFDKGARQVTGGIERLFYVSPYQLNKLVKAARHRHGAKAGRCGRDLAQQWLNRMNVGEEVLGAEALSQLIRYFIPAVVDPECFAANPADAEALCGTFAPFLGKGVMVLATATDLTDGRLLTLGDPFHDRNASSRIDLTDSLLASSAFPGVFRPRWAPEVFPDTPDSNQLIDGGVMDNLPIDAVLNILWKASVGEPDDRLIVRRPRYGDGADAPAPHLAFAASLEPELAPVPDEELGELQSYWPALRTRARQLGYNTKLNNYRDAATEISSLHDQFPDSAIKPPPLNLEIAAVKPRWLCGTFAFHPMLGYRRSKQAESIAHGCALTLLKFKHYAGDGEKDAWLDAWGVRRPDLPVAKTLEEAQARWTECKRQPGACWLREARRCPFSQAALNELNTQLEPAHRLAAETIREISYIHQCCERQATHEPH